MRNLASIQQISDIQPIEGADKIMRASVLGWQVVVAKKDNFQKNDTVVYCEIDSVLPERPEFEFLKDRKYRIRTIKLKNTLSQGIVFPLSILPKGKYKVGDDVTEVLGIKKYDLEGDKEREAEAIRVAVQKNRMKKFIMRYSWFRKLFIKQKHGGFPTFVSKTDEVRIQAVPQVLDQNRFMSMYVTEKVDGSSMTVYIVKGKFFSKLFGVCSRNIHLGTPDTSNFWKYVILNDVEKKLRKAAKELRMNIVLQGELVGPGVQGNKYGLKERHYFIFNIWNPDTGVYFDLGVMQDFCKKYGFEMVPVLHENKELDFDVEGILEYAKGESVLAEIPREGLVFRDRHNVTAHRLSFKAINNDFLLKYD